MSRLRTTDRETARGLGWGLVDQCLSSATNFALFLLAGRALGPSGLGVVLIGFSAYLVALGLQRALVSDPLVSLTSAVGMQDRAAPTRSSLTGVLMLASTASVLTAGAGLVVPGDIGRGLLLFAPWLVPALVQDFWRTMLFRDNRASAATLNDALWLVAMVAVFVGAWLLRTDWAVVACWGSGATAGAAFGFVQMRSRPESTQRAWVWWRTKAWPFGRWLGVNGILYSFSSYLTIIVLAAMLGTSALGGLRAVESTFAPLSLIAPAIALPGLPAIARELSKSPAAARALALRFGLVASAVIVTYVLVLGLGGRRLIPMLFGASFAPYTGLVWPIGAGQALAASAIGFVLLLKAERRGGAILIAGAVTSAASLGLASALAWFGGVSGAAWGLAGGSAAGALVMAIAALSGPTGRRAEGRRAPDSATPLARPILDDRIPATVLGSHGD